MATLLRVTGEHPRDYTYNNIGSRMPSHRTSLQMSSSTEKKPPMKTPN